MPESPSTPSEREQRLERILADYLHAVEAGQQPDGEEWLRRHCRLGFPRTNFAKPVRRAA